MKYVASRALDKMIVELYSHGIEYESLDTLGRFFGDLSSVTRFNVSKKDGECNNSTFTAGSPAENCPDSGSAYRIHRKKKAVYVLSR